MATYYERIEISISKPQDTFVENEKKTTTKKKNEKKGEEKKEDSFHEAESKPLSSSSSKEEEKKELKTYTTFDEMNLNSDILRGIYAYGFEKPSVIQQKAIVPIIKGTDIIAQSQSGTGKTGAFTIGVLQRINVKENKTQVLLLAHTRELAKQLHLVLRSLAYYVKNLRVELAIGGVKSKYSNAWDTNKNHIVIGTPGRILDNITRKRLDVSDLKMLVIDEADEMLSRGFELQMKDIIQHIPPKAQIALFSATMPKEVIAITKRFMNDPLKILVKKEDVTLEGIQQYYVLLDKRDHKIDCLLDIFGTISITQSIIYANTKKMVEYLYNVLDEKKFSVGMIHGGMNQDDRNIVMKNFREGKYRVLLATDMLARGIDVQQISLVVNYDLPREKETYIHRIGRGGRFGRKGTALNLVTPEEKNRMKLIEQFYETSVQELPQNIKDIL